jgi:hypothetical protein
VIPLSDLAHVVQLSPAMVRYVRVESWLDGELLAEDVPIIAGSETVDRTSRVPERVTLTVPRIGPDGFDWSPVGDTHPLAANGQRLKVMLGVGLVGTTAEYLQRGEFLISRAEVDGDEVTLECVGLLALIDEARLVSPYQPTGTLASTLRGLIEPALTVVIDAALVDRAVPAGINYDEDRLGAVLEVLAAWPAQAQVTNDGYLLVEPVPAAYSADFTAEDTLIEQTGESSREGVFTAVVAKGTASDGAQVFGVAYAYGTGPHRYGGPFNPHPVPFLFPSPLLTTAAQAQAAARTRLASLLLEQSRASVVECVPLIGAQAGDVAELPGGVLGLIQAMTLPYTADGGAMTLTVVEVPA